MIARFIYRILVSLDQLGNTLGGGHEDITISARTGYCASILNRKWWKIVEAIINFTFYPIDGKNHCLQAYRADPRQDKYWKGNAFNFVVVAILATIVCIPVSIILWTLYLLTGGEFGKKSRKT